MSSKQNRSSVIIKDQNGTKKNNGGRLFRGPSSVALRKKFLFVKVQGIVRRNRIRLTNNTTAWDTNWTATVTPPPKVNNTNGRRYKGRGGKLPRKAQR